MTGLNLRNPSSSELLTGAKIAVLVGSVLAIYSNDLVAIFNEALNSELTSYVLILPFLIGYLVYRKRSALKAAISFDLTNRSLPIETLEGTILMAAALIYSWGISFTSDPLSYRSLSIPFFTFGALLALFGKNTLRTALFPVALSLFITPLPGDFSTYWGGVLSLYTTSASVAVIRAMGVGATTNFDYGSPIVIYQSVVGDQVAFVVSIACSGLYSLTGFAAFSAFAAYIPNGKLLAKITLFAIGFGVVYALNILRVIIILMMGRFYGQGAALATFHTFAGTFLIFIGTLGILFLGEKVWRLKFTRAPILTSECKHDESHLNVLGGFCSLCGRLIRFPSKVTHRREAGTIVIVVALTALMLMAQVPLFAYVRGPNPDAFSIPAGNTSPPALLPNVTLSQSNWSPTFDYRDQYFEQVTTSGYVAAAWIYEYYRPHINSSGISVITTSVELAVPGGDALIDYPFGPRHSEVDLKTPYNHNATYILKPQDSPIIENPFISGALYIYQDNLNPGLPKIVYYWYEYATFRQGSSYNTYHILTTLRTNTEFLTTAGLLTGINNATQIESTQIENIMRSVATQIVQYWVPVANASLLSRYLTPIRQTLLPVLSIGVLAAAFYAGFREVTDPIAEPQLEAMINKLQTPEDKALINEFYQEKRRETAEQARLGLSRKGYQADLGGVVTKLTGAERLGLVHRRLRWIDDQAYQEWSQPSRNIRISRIWSWRSPVS
jgi:exosortase